MTIFNSFLYVYQRVHWFLIPDHHTSHVWLQLEIEPQNGAKECQGAADRETQPERHWLNPNEHISKGQRANLVLHTVWLYDII